MPRERARAWVRAEVASGRDELVDRPVAPVADAPGGRVDGQRDRAHQLPDLGLAADVVPTPARPGPEMLRISVELVRTGVDGRGCAQRGRCLARDDVHDRDAERRADDRLTAAGAPLGIVLVEDGGDPDAHDRPPRNLVALTRGL